MSIKYKDQLIAGAPGKDATINGQNTLEIVAGENITIEQKNNALTISSSGGGGSSENVYSTEETRIGTWIDGKPLYRKMFLGTLSSSTITNIGDPIEKLEELLYLFGMVKGANGYWTPLTFVAGGTCLVQVHFPSNVIEVYNTVTGFYNSPIKVEAVYTKTTDVATINLMRDIPSVMSLNDAPFTPVTTDISYASVTSSVVEPI